MCRGIREHRGVPSRRRTLLFAGPLTPARRTALGLAEVELVGAAKDLEGARRDAQRLRPDAVLLDATLAPELPRAVSQLLALAPSTHVLVLGRRDTDDAVFLRAMHAGASGYVDAEAEPQALAAAVRDVLAGQVAVPRALVTELIEALRAD
jgi:DNA-binding NarL/FixJ family response regulator